MEQHSSKQDLSSSSISKPVALQQQWVDCECFHSITIHSFVTYENASTWTLDETLSTTMTVSSSPWNEAMDFRRFLEDTTDDTEFSDSQVLRDTLILYGCIFAVTIGIFSVLRQRFPRTYSVRSWSEKIKSPLASQYQHGGLLSWLWKVHAISEEDFVDECGMDATCFLRLIRMGARISAVGVFNTLWLLPTYVTAADSPETEDIGDNVVKTTIAHVPSESPRLVATALASYIFFGFIMYTILEEFNWYIRIRHRFLKKPLPRHFTIFVRNIPHQYKDNQRLQNFFGGCFGEDSIVEARCPLVIPNLEKAVAERDATVEKLEHALAQFQHSGERPTHKEPRNKDQKMSFCGPKVQVDSIETYTQQLEEQNTSVEEQIGKLLEIQSGSMHMMNQTDTVDVDDDGQSPKNLAASASAAVSKSMKMATGSATAAIGKSMKMAKSLVGQQEDGHLHSSGFVVFNRIGTANAALQSIHYDAPFQMEVVEAPDPDDVFWGNIARSHKSLQLGKLGSFAATTALCLLWTIPMSFFASLSNASAVREDVEFLDDLFDKYPGLVTVTEQAAPFLVVIFNALLPIILTHFTLFEGPISSGVVASSVFVKLAAFMIIQTFFVSAISGSLMQAISDIIDDWTEIIDLLANSLPAQSTYFHQIALVTTTMNTVFELPRLVAIITSFIRSKVGPNLTEKERNRIFMGLRPMSDPTPFLHPKFTSQLVLYYMIMMVYTVIAPITPVITGGVFLFIWSMYKHQFVHNYPVGTDSGGKLYANFIQVILTCMLIAESKCLKEISRGRDWSAQEKSSLTTNLLFCLFSQSLFLVYSV